MKRTLLLGLAAACSLAIVTVVSAKPVTYQLPEETAAFKPGPNLDVVQGNCGACHSADYIQTQPRGPKFGKDFWQAEVMTLRSWWITVPCAKSSAVAAHEEGLGQELHVAPPGTYFEEGPGFLP